MGIDAVESEAVLPQQHVDVGKRLLPAVHLKELDFAEDRHAAFVERRAGLGVRPDMDCVREYLQPVRIEVAGEVLYQTPGVSD